ncbi:hypothetical protein HW555_004040 [Spodoptera exigua]|uniref:THAP-type domain-containing protein n=1 Tax=Spodoptera exigua TaxID=7107 RepID=A0A835GM89_SPOEX|nr:hypothetical protein HW555_004040 [Spodoptera exigua]
MEPKVCSILDCDSRSDQGDEELCFFGFPRKPKYRRIWVAATGRRYWSAKRSSRICSKHFLPACFAEGVGKSLLENAVPTEFIKNPPRITPERSESPGSPEIPEMYEIPARPESPEITDFSSILRSSTPLSSVLGDRSLEPDELEDPVEWPEPGFIKTPPVIPEMYEIPARRESSEITDFSSILRSSSPLSTVLGDRSLQLDELQDTADWPNPGVKFIHLVFEEQIDPNQIVLRSTAVSLPEPGTSSTITEAEMRRKPVTESVSLSARPPTDGATRPPEELASILSITSPSRPATGPTTPERHRAPKSTKSATPISKEGSGSNFLPSWVRIPPEYPVSNPKEAGSTFRKKLFAFLRCPYNPLDIESDLRTLISLGVPIFILRRGNFRAVVNSLFRYFIEV